MLISCVQQLDMMAEAGGSITGWRDCRRFLPVLMIVFFCAGLLPGFGGAFLPVNTTSGDNLTAAFFYTEHCAACIKALPVMDAIADEYPSVSVLTYSVSGGTENESLFFRYGEAYGNSYPRYPTVFLSDGMFFEGYRAISADLPDHLASCLRGSETEEGSAPGVASALLPVTPLPSSSPTISPLNSSAVSSLSSSAPAVYSPALPPVWVVIVAGLVDGINPCAVAVLIFLLLTLVGAGGSLQMLRFGAAYVVGIYLMYFISGFGVLSAVRIVGFSFYFSCAAGFIAIIFGGIMLVDSFRAAGPGHFHISVSLLASVRQIAARGGIMSAFLAGVVVSLIELPCTGGVYLAILAMLSGVDVYAAAGLLALYNLMFVLPLVVIIAAAVAGFSPERMSVMRLESRQALRRAGGGALILLGAAVLIWFVG